MEMTTEAALQKGIKAQKSGQIQVADKCYTAILQVQPKHPDANHNMGVLAVSIGKVQEALPFFKTALKFTPSTQQFWLSYIDALVRLGQLYEARVVLNEAKTICSKSEAFDNFEAKLLNLEKTGHEVNSLMGKSTKVPKANILDSFKLDQALKLAKQNAKDGKYEDAQNIYQDIIKKFPGNKKAASALKLLSEGAVKNSKDPPPEVCSSIINLFAQGQFQQALAEAERTLKIFQNSAFLHNIIGASNAGLRNFVIAISNYKKALKINPNYADAYYSMGVALQEQDDFTAAILSYKQALKIEPDYIEAHLNMGKIFKGQGDIEASVLSYNLALKISPDLPEAHYNMGNALKEKGLLDDAIASYNKALKINPDLTEAHYNMAIVLKEKGELDSAIDSYKRALKINPEYADAFNNMGVALTERGDLDAAITSYQQALNIKPDYVDAYSNMGNALKEKGDLDAAIDSYKRALKINPSYADAFNNMGAALVGTGDLDAAVKSYQQVLKIKPDLAEAYLGMGSALQKQGDLDAAINSYKSALKIKPDYVQALNNMGAAQKQKGDIEAAVRSFKQALKIKPDYAVVQHILDALTGKQTESAPNDYIEALFDDYAVNFDDGLVKKLEYRFPKLIAELIIKNQSGAPLGSILDLGCGTGLVGVELKEFCHNIEGIDLSKEMLTEARRKNVYDTLNHTGIIEYLSEAILDFDLFVSADVFVYVGELSEVFSLIKSRNKRKGRLAFSTEHTQKDGFTLETSGRFSHSRSYIESLCEEFDYQVLHFSKVNLRKEKGEFLTGGLYLLEF